jgi:hypothetical protein
LYLGLVFQSGLSSLSHRISNNRSLAPPMKMSPSAALKP